MTNNDLAVELLQQRKKKREDPQSATTQTSTQNMSGQAALAQELLSQRIQARKEREATQPTVSLPSQRIDPAKERQESNGKFNGWKYFGNLGKTLLTGVASLAQTGAMAEDVVTSAVDTIFKGANTKGSGLFNALYHGRPDWKFLGENGLVGIEQEKAYLDQEREAEIAKIKDDTLGGKVAKKAASYGGDIAYGVGGAIPMAATAGVAAAPIVNGVATSTEALANLGASVVESSGVLNALGKGFRDTLRSKDYWMAFTSEVGADYQEALSDGASTGEAMNYAIATSLLNSVIEVGGGIQKVPENFSVKNLLRSAAEEGMEEIWQGPVGRTMQNVVYGANNPIVSTTDDRAIFNPVTSAQEFAGGFTVGGILSGAQMAAGKAANSIYSKQVEKQSQRYEQAQARVKELSGVKGTYQTGENGKTTVGGNESAIKSVVKGGQIEMANGEVVSPDKVKFADRNTADLYEGAISRAANAGAANVFIDSYTGGDVSRYLLGMQEAYEDGRAGVVTEKRGTFADDLTDAQRTAAWNQGAADGLQSFRSDTGLGENGSAAWTQVQQNQAVRSNPRLRTGFTSMYQAGLSGKALTDVKSDAAKYIPPSVQTAAYQAGLADAASSLAREKAGVKLVTRSGEPGLTDNDYSRNLANKDAGTARVLGALASDMGVRIEIVPQVQGGAANGKYVSKTNTIQLAADADNPLAFVAAHEVTHRMQDAAPTEYRTYRDAVMEYRSSELGDDTAASMVERYREASREAGVTLTQEEAMDEIAADFTAKMINDTDLFGRFADKNRSAAGKLLDGLKAFISRVKALFTGKARDKAAQEAYGKNFADLQKVADLWQTAYDKASETIRESTNAATANADESAKLQIRRKYWKPQLRSDEWALLNRKLDEEIGSSEQYLDESTKWLYADEKGVQVFALYGIGDGTEATPLYAVGGKQARYAASLMRDVIEEVGRSDGNAEGFDSWAENLRSKNGNYRRNYAQAGDGKPAGRNAGLHGSSQGRNTGKPAGDGKGKSSGVREKFSVRESAGRIVKGSNGALYWNDLSYRGYTEDKAIPDSIGYAMFADDPHAIENYGSRFAVVRHDDLPTIDDFKESIAKAWERDKAKYLLPPELEVFSDRSGAEMADHFDPVDIIDGADAWDTPELITWAFSHGIFDEVGGVKTSDGAIVWDESLLHGTSDDGGVWGGNLHEEKYSIRDSAGRELTAAQQDYFKDSKVRDAEGNLLVMYHQTDGAFTVFDTRHKGAGTGDDETPFGIFLKRTGLDIGVRGKNQMELYANIRNPLRVRDRAELVARLRELSGTYAELKDQSGKIDKEYGAKFAEAKDAFKNFLLQWRKENPDAPSRAAYDAEGFDAAFDAEDNVVKEWTQKKDELALRAKEAITDALRKNGYDGVVLESDRGSWGRSTDAYIALDANQVKNVTNQNPTGDADIRFQLKSQTQIETEMRDIKKERDRLKARVKSLERQVARWKAETKPSMPSFREGDLKKLGNRLINDFDSSTKYSEIKTDMENLGKALLSQDVPDTDLHAYAEYVAEKIIQNSRVLEEGGEDLLEIQKHLKSVKLAYTDDGSIPDFSEWKKAHRDIKFAKDGGLPVDVAYHELTELFGSGYFPENIVHPADQLTRMGEVLEDIDNIWSNPYDEYRDIAVTALGNALIEGMISDDVRQTRPTYADRKEQEIAHLKDLLSKTRASRDEKIKQMRTAYAERTKAGAERRKASEIRARISKHAGTLSQKLLHPTDKQHIPEQLRTPVAALLRSINTESTRSYDENGRLRSGNNGTPTQRTQDAIRLREAYDSILSNDPNFVIDPALFGGDGTSGFIDQLVQLGNQRIDEMNTAQLNVIWKAIKGIETTITSYDKALASGKYMFISQWANDLRNGVSSRKRANKKAVLSLYDPRTFFNAYGDAGLDVFRALRNAEDTQNRRVAEVAKLTEKFMSREVYKQRDERHTFTTEAGQTITLTNDQIMNLYNLANRGKHSMQHLSVGGVIQPYIKRDGKLPAIERGTKSIPLTANDVAQITDVLTDEQIKVAKGLQKIASTMLAKWGNEASMAVYGYNKFTEEHYWPIKSAREAIVQNAERGENMPREIRNMGSAKALNENASNTLDLGGVFDVFTKNASDMITYSTMLEPMEDINRLFNYRYRDSAGNLTGKNVKNVLTDVYGEQALKYWRNLMSDVQNGIAHDDEPITRMIEKFVGRTKAASVGMNARVVLQQPTAFFRAAAILDPSDMAKGLVKAPTKGNGWKKAKQYAGIAAIKDSSGFDQAGQYTIMRGILNGADQTFMDKLSDASGAAAAKADAVTWGKIWNACEYTVQKEGRYEVGSEEFYTRTAEVFSDVIDQSQVVDGILQRTQIMRSGNGLTKQATAFMGEPMKSLNMLLRSYDAWRYETNPSKKSAALKQFARTSIALLVTDGVNALVQSLVDAARKDDKDKDYWGRYFEVLTGVTGEDDTVASVLLGSNLWDNIDPVGRIPFAKDIKSMLQGYTVSRMDADAVSDFIAAAQLFTKATQGDGQKTTLYAFKQLLVTGSKIFGVSVGNIGRDTWAVARSIAQETGSYWAMYQMEQMIYRVAPDAKNSSRYYSILYHALQDDKAAYDRIYADLISKGYTDKQIKTGMKNAIKNAGGSDMLSQLEDVGFSREDAETVIKQQEFKQSYGFSYDDLADEYADGNISRREVIRALQNVGGLSAEDGELKATAYDWKNAGVSDATNAIVKAYQSYGSDAGFDKKSFAEAYKDLNAVKGEDTDGDGKIEKKQFVLEAINKMNISAAQKDALYRMKGYGEKQLADAPWH